MKNVTVIIIRQIRGHTKIHVALSLNIDENKYPRLAEDS